MAKYSKITGDRRWPLQGSQVRSQSAKQEIGNVFEEETLNMVVAGRSHLVPGLHPC